VPLKRRRRAPSSSKILKTTKVTKFQLSLLQKFRNYSKIDGGDTVMMKSQPK